LRFGAGTFAAPAFAQDKGTIGIAMPTKSSARWISDGNSMVEQFEAAGYETDLQYAEDDIPNQLAQIENMITKEVDALVIAAIDGTTLSNALENAAALGIPVIAYDRLIRDSGMSTITPPSTTSRSACSRPVAGRGPRRTVPRCRPVERRTVRRLARRQQRLFLLRRRDERAAAADRRRQDQHRLRPDGHGHGRHAALGRRGRAGAHG
jgi:hypothetical protein